MSGIIEEFYKKNNIMPLLLKRKLSMFEKHPDIATEFEKWIQTGKYVTENSVVVEGYTAARLASEISNLAGEGAFMVLIELREDPAKALKRLKDGFKKK